jgi:hypothetical protein
MLNFIILSQNITPYLSTGEIMQSAISGKIIAGFLPWAEQEQAGNYIAVLQ